MPIGIRGPRSQTSPRASASAGPGSSPASVRDQALAGELGGGLGERRVGRRQDHVRADELVVIDRLALAPHELEPLAPQVVELPLVAGGHRGHGVVVERVQAVDSVLWHLELPLRGDSDDHAPSLPCSSAGESAAGALPVPSSAFILDSSSSPSAPDESCASSLSMSSWPPPPSCVMSSNAPAFSSSSTALARARMLSTLSSARCIARPM